MKVTRTYSKLTLEIAHLLGQQIKLARKQRRWSEVELAERASIARATLQKIEKGDTTCALGLVFELAILVGVPLFEGDTPSVTSYLTRTQDHITLLPKRIHATQKEIDDDF